MAYSLKAAQVTKSRVPAMLTTALLLLAACNAADKLDPESSDMSLVEAASAAMPVSATAMLVRNWSALTDQTAPAGTAVFSRPTLNVVDRNRRLTPGVSVTFSIVYGGGCLADSVQVSDAKGLVRLGEWVLGAAAGKNKIKAVIAGSNYQYFYATGAKNGSVPAGTPVGCAAGAPRDSTTAPGASTPTQPHSIPADSTPSQVPPTDSTPVVPARQAVASLTISPASARISDGESVMLVATVKDASGATLTGRAVTWTTSASRMATVSSSGTVTGVAAGSATIKATSEGKSATATITVVVPTPIPVPDPTPNPGADPTPNPPPPPSGGPVGSAIPSPLGQSNGPTYYVSPTGSDANSGARSAPWKTLGRAMRGMTPGERVYVLAGTYETGGTFGTEADTYEWDANCSPAAPCSILASPGDRPIIHGMVKITGSYLRMSGFILEGPLSRNSASASERRANQVYMNGAHDIEFSHNEVRDNDYHAGMYLSGVHHVQLISNYIHDNGRFNLSSDPSTGSSTTNVDHGVYWSSTSGGGNLIANNIFEHNRGFGLQLYRAPTDIMVTQNTFVGNGNSGVIIAGTADRITLVNNIAAFNGKNQQLLVQSGGSNVIQNNLTYSPSGSLSGVANSTSSRLLGNMINDPRFASMSGHDFHLIAGSMAIDRATAASSMGVDYTGAPRPRGAAPDLGALEY